MILINVYDYVTQTPYEIYNITGTPKSSLRSVNPCSHPHAPPED